MPIPPASPRSKRRPRPISEPSRYQPITPRPVRITGEQLAQYLKKIEGYFMVEYRLLLSRVARLASKSIIRAGDVADHRLDDLEAAA